MLVTDVHHRFGLAGLRDLGRAGLDVLSLAVARCAPGAWSRYSADWELAPDSAEDASAFFAALADVVRRRGPFVVFPSSEPTIDALIEARSELPPAALLPYPSLDSLGQLRDKRQLPDLAVGAGLLTPRKLMSATAGELAARPPLMPFALKQVGPGGALDQKTRIVTTSAALSEILAGVPPEEPVLVQERMQGALVGLALVIDREYRLAARFQQVARRLWPVDAGGSALAVSVVPDDDLVRRSHRMLVDAGFWGLAHLQFIRTARGFALIDVNPRFYGSMPLAAASGVNLPAIWHAVVTGGDIPPMAAYRVGVHYRWLKADLRAGWRESARAALLPTPKPKTGAIWAADDPVPCAVVAYNAVRRASRVVTARS